MADKDSKEAGASSKLFDTSVSSIVPKDRSLVALWEITSMEKAHQTLSETRINAAPVFNEDSVLVGTLDTMDLLWFEYQELKNERRTKDATVKDVLASSGSKHKMVPFSSENSLSSLVEFFAKNPRVHRVALHSDSGELMSLCSQTDVVRYIATHLMDKEQIRSMINKPVREIMNKSIVTAGPDITVIQCVEALLAGAAPAIALVDIDGRLVGQFEPGSLKGLLSEESATLNEKIQSYSTMRYQNSSTAVSIEKNATVSDAIVKMITGRQHRLWVIDPDDQDKTINLIEMSDIIKLVSSNKTISKHEMSGVSSNKTTSKHEMSGGVKHPKELRYKFGSNQHAPPQKKVIDQASVAAELLGPHNAGHHKKP